jgi:hypothetical protein
MDHKSLSRRMAETIGEVQSKQNEFGKRKIN